MKKLSMTAMLAAALGLAGAGASRWKNKYVRQPSA
jgi:hypothetical protein